MNNRLFIVILNLIVVCVPLHTQEIKDSVPLVIFGEIKNALVVTKAFLLNVQKRIRSSCRFPSSNLVHQ